MKRRRNSLRLEGYDYALEGLYFLTICCKGMHHHFGKVSNSIMGLNAAGCLVWDYLYRLEYKFPHILLDEMIVMPNHIHLIVEILPCVWVDPCVHPNHIQNREGKHVSSPPRHGIPDIVQWFKTMTTNAYIRGIKKQNWPPFYKKLWQRGYYDHIIRSEFSYRKISTYIRENPKRWDKDRFNP